MFKFLKEKLSKTISRFSKKADEEGEKVEEAPEEKDVLEEGSEEKEVQEEQPEEEQEDKEDEKELQDKESEEEKTETEEKKEDKESIEEPKEEKKEEIQEKSEELEEPAEEETKEELQEEIEDKKVKDHIEKEEEPESIAETESVVEPETSAEEEDQKEDISEEKEVSESPKETETEKIEEDIEEKEEPIEEEKNEEVKEEKPEKKKGFFSRIRERVTKTVISENKFDDLFWDIEMVLLENNVAVEVIEKIKKDLKENIVDHPIERGNIEKRVLNSLKDSINDLFTAQNFVLDKEMKNKKPYVICFIGINGSGKTTTIAKIAYMLKQKGLEPVLAASDTFRAAAIDQLTHHAEKIGVKIIKHDYGSDAAAVAFDAVKHAESKNKDAVLIDTAGRMHSNSNLMQELKKVVRVAKPDLKVFVGESITGNDCVEQAKKFDEEIGIDAIILTKADIDEKGGAPLSISYVTKRPIIFIGTGQEYSNIKEFDPETIIKNLGI